LSNSRLAVLVLCFIALVVAGLAVQTYWDCQLVHHYAAKDCVPAHAALGEVGRAREIVAEAIASNSALTTDYVENHEFYRDPAVKRTLIQLLDGAGLPSRAAPNAKARPASKPAKPARA
jgi:hypothetical protein